MEIDVFVGVFGGSKRGQKDFCQSAKVLSRGHSARPIEIRASRGSSRPATLDLTDWDWQSYHR